MRISTILMVSFLLVALIPLSIISYINFDASRDIAVGLTLYDLEKDAKLHADKINNLLDGFEENVLFLSNLPLIQERNNAWDENNSELSSLEENLEETFKIMGESNLKKYMQIRYIDEAGMEIARVDSDGSSVKIIPKDKLQNKGDRYYFTETIKLNPGEIYLSALDLNREGAPPVVEIPPKPVIRYASPVIDSNGEKRGIVIINFFANHVLESFHPILHGQEGLQEFLIDKEGFYFVNSNENKKWGSSRDLNTGENYFSDFLSEENKLRILSGEDGVISRSEQDYVLSYSTIFPDSTKDEEFWIVLEVVPRAIILSEVTNLKNKLFIVGILFMMVILVLAFFISRSISKPIKKLTYTVEEVTKGKLDLQLPKSRIKEVQKLTDSLNRILASLKLAILKTGSSKEDMGLTGSFVEENKNEGSKTKESTESSETEIITKEKTEEVKEEPEIETEDKPEEPEEEQVKEKPEEQEKEHSKEKKVSPANTKVKKKSIKLTKKKISKKKKTKKTTSKSLKKKSPIKKQIKNKK